MCGSLECFPGIPVKEPVFHTQHLQTLLPLVVDQQVKVNTKSTLWDNYISSRSPGVKSENNLFPLDCSNPLFWAGSLSCIWIKAHKSLSNNKRISGNATSLNISHDIRQWCICSVWCDKLKFQSSLKAKALAKMCLGKWNCNFSLLPGPPLHTWAGVPRSWIFQKSSLSLQAFLGLPVSNGLRGAKLVLTT